MKNVKTIAVVFLAALLFLSADTYAGYNHFRAVYDKYKEKNSVFSLTFSSSSFSSFLNNKDKELRDALNHIDNIRMLSYDSQEIMADFKADLKNCFRTEHYEDLLEINDGADHIEIKAIKEGRKITELVMVITDKHSLTVLYMEGEINLDNARKIAKEFSQKDNNK